MTEFKAYLVDEGKSPGTIKKYIENVGLYQKWYAESYGEGLQRLFRPNILEYISYLKNIKHLNAKTINGKLSALLKYNEFLGGKLMIIKKDFIKVQTETASPTDVTKVDVEKFRQLILKEGGERNYAIVTLLAYAGLRISEALALKLNDVNLTSRELIIRSGKGGKQRVVYLNDKIVEAIKGYLEKRSKQDDTGYLFLSNKGGKLDRTSINKVFNEHSDKITPHTLRHFFCTNALESGYSVHEVANQAGHSNIHTTLLYTNPNIEKMKQKANLL